jgi:hypothetical protein
VRPAGGRGRHDRLAADDTIVVRAQLLRAKGTTLSAAGWDVSIKVRRDNASEWSAMHAE